VGGLMVMDESVDSIRLRLKKLESTIDSLRLGRRILMNLLIEQEMEKKAEIRRLTNEIKRLKRILKNHR